MARPRTAWLAAAARGAGAPRSWSSPPRLRPPPATVAGAARVIDGDTLAIGAVARPAARRSTRPRRTSAAAAPAAELAVRPRPPPARLTALAAGGGPLRRRRARPLRPADRDAARAGGIDLGGRLVAEGLAWAYVRYSDAYVADEAGARARHAGLWHGPAEAPWDFRAAAASSPGPALAAAAGTVGGRAAGRAACVKGNVAPAGARIYHLPGDRSYARTRIDPARGEAWFCDDAAAEAAGFRPAHPR